MEVSILIMHELTVPNRSYHIVVVTYTALSACTVAARPGEGIHNTIRKSVGCECILYYGAGSDVQRPFDHFCTCSPYKALGSRCTMEPWNSNWDSATFHIYMESPWCLLAPVEGFECMILCMYTAPSIHIHVSRMSTAGVQPAVSESAVSGRRVQRQPFRPNRVTVVVLLKSQRSNVMRYRSRTHAEYLYDQCCMSSFSYHQRQW